MTFSCYIPDAVGNSKLRMLNWFYSERGWSKLFGGEPGSRDGTIATLSTCYLLFVNPLCSIFWLFLSCARHWGTQTWQFLCFKLTAEELSEHVNSHIYCSTRLDISHELAVNWFVSKWPTLSKNKGHTALRRHDITGVQLWVLSRLALENNDILTDQEWSKGADWYCTLGRRVQLSV